MLREDVSPQKAQCCPRISFQWQDFSGGCCIAAKPSPNSVLSVLNITWHSPALPGEHSNPWAVPELSAPRDPIPGVRLLQWLQAFLAIPSLLLFISSFHQNKQLKMDLIFCLLRCPSLAVSVLTRLWLFCCSHWGQIFLAAINFLTSLPTSFAGKAAGSLRCFGLIIWCYFVSVGKLAGLGSCTEKPWWTGAGKSCQGLTQRVKNLDSTLLPFPPSAGGAVTHHCGDLRARVP